MDASQSIKRELRRVSRWYPRQVACVRVGVGIWLLVLTAVLYDSGHGGEWAWLLVPIAALHFFMAYRLFRAGEARLRSKPAVAVRRGGVSLRGLSRARLSCAPSLIARFCGEMAGGGAAGAARP
jgi:hypothetical protein